jgi:predicted RNase H-like HicB family nuclease
LTNPVRYPAQIFWSDEDEGYIAVARDLPGCSAFGESQQEALAELQHAIAAWIEASRAAGNPIPEPSKPAVEDNYSGKVLVRMPKSLHANIAKEAKDEGVSLNQQIVFLLASAVTRCTFRRKIFMSYNNTWQGAWDDTATAWTKAQTFILPVRHSSAEGTFFIGTIPGELLTKGVSGVK